MATATRGVVLDRANPNFTFIREFGGDLGTSGMWQTLTDYGCGPFESSRYIEWFWRRSESWRPFSSQSEFSTYARERLSDEVGFTRRKLDAYNTITRYFDKGDELKLDDVLDAVTFCSPTQPMAHAVYENTTAVIIDLTKRAGDDKFLKIEKDFLPTLIRLFPWERRESSVIKVIPVGGTTREFDLATLAFWFRHKNANRDEMRQAVAFHSADRLDWTATNLYSRWREGLLAERYAGRVNPLLEVSSTIPTIDVRFPKKLKEGESEPTRPAKVVSLSPSSDLFLESPSKASLVMPLLEGSPDKK